VLKPVSTISKATIVKACIAFRNAALGMEGDETPLGVEVQDVIVYEHVEFPGTKRK
jgi:alkylated DNA repair protein alkB family protein 1